MKFGTLTFLIAVVLFCVLPIPVRLAAAQNASSPIISFHAATAGDGTFPESINKAGTITGHYTDRKGLYHGFLRSPVGEFITFDAPGAGKTAGSGWGTFPESISDAGAITGHYIDSKDVNHGFVRAPSGDSPRLMLRARARAQVPDRGPILTASATRGLSRGTTLTRTVCTAVSCVLLRVSSSASMRPAWT
jgi:hypothetical protein